MSGETTRLFVAADPPVHVRDRMAAWARAALIHGAKESHRSRIRLTETEMIHITVCFLGNRPFGEIESIKTALYRCAAPAGELSLGAPVWLPEGRPRALAIEVHDNERQLTRLWQGLRRALLEEIGLEFKAGRFRPHGTVARMPAGEIPKRLRVLMATPALRFTAQSLTLYRSRLAADGASHEPLLSLALDGTEPAVPYSAADER